MVKCFRHNLAAIGLAATLTLGVAMPAAAQFQLQAIGTDATQAGPGFAPVDGVGPDDFEFTAGWDQSDADAMPFFSLRGTWWRSEETGFSLDFTRSRAYADEDAVEQSGFEVLEFTDGVNTVTVNAIRRFDPVLGLRPYVGGGLGLAFPNVEVQTESGATMSAEYQLGGVVAQVQGGVEYDLGNQWSLFGEYKMNILDLDMDLDGGASLDTNLITNAVNIGAGFTF